MAEFSSGLRYITAASCNVSSRPTTLAARNDLRDISALLHNRGNIESVDPPNPIDLNVSSVAKQGRTTRVPTDRGCVWSAGELANGIRLP